MNKVLAVLLLVALGGVAAANKDKADVLFRQGKKLMAEKRYADACRSFEQSFDLDPGIGAELNVARCYEEWGKLATAYRAYQKAEHLANEAHDVRADKIHGLVEALEPQVPKLAVRLPKDADTSALKVWIDGALIEASTLADAQLIDPGPHLLEYQVGSEQKKTKTIPVERGGSSEVKLDVPVKVAIVDVKPNPKPPIVVEPRDPGRTQRFAGIGVGGAGVVAIGIASVMTLSARSKYNAALAMQCGGMTNGCNPQGLTDTHAARHTANIATIVFLLGVGAVGGGVALYLMAPHAHGNDEHALYLAPTLDTTTAGFVVGGEL